MITKANAVYTGGNIWIFYGELDDGTYFLTDNDGYTVIVNESPDDFEESLYIDWIEDHKVRDIEDEDERIAFCNELCDRLLIDGMEGGFTDDDVAYYREWFAEPL